MMINVWCQMSWWCHPAHVCAALLMSGHRPGALQVLCCILLIFVTKPERGNPGFGFLGSILREKETRDRGPVMQIIPHPVFFIYRVWLKSKIISLSETGCVQLWSLEEAAPSPSHVWSVELGVTTEFPSSCNNFTQPADTDRQPGSSHSLHITGQHENSDNTS